MITPTLGGEEQTTRRLHHQTTRVVVEPTTRVQAGGFLTTRVLAGGFPTTRAEAGEFLNTLVPADGFLTTRVPADGFPITWEVAEGVRTFHWRVVEHPTTLAGTLEHLTTDTPTTQRVVAPTTREEGAGQLIPSTTNTFLLPLVTPSKFHFLSTVCSEGVNIDLDSNSQSANKRPKIHNFSLLYLTFTLTYCTLLFQLLYLTFSNCCSYERTVRAGGAAHRRTPSYDQSGGSSGEYSDKPPPPAPR